MAGADSLERASRASDGSGYGLTPGDAGAAGDCLILAPRACLRELAPMLDVLAPRASQTALDELSSGWEPSDPQSTVLLLYPVDGDGAESAVRVWRRCCEAGIPTGLLPFTDEHEARARLIVALLSACLGVVAGPPIVLRRGFDNAALLASGVATTSSLLVAAGHGNPIDLGFLDGTILCGRRDARVKRPDSFPCIPGHDCFRQARFGRSPDDVTGLVDPTRFAPPLAVFCGCGTAPLPGGPAAFRDTLVARALAGGSAAVAATTGQTAISDASLAAIVADVFDGRPLKEALRAVSHVGDGNATTHLVVYGHPGARMAAPCTGRLEVGPCADDPETLRLSPLDQSPVQSAELDGVEDGLLAVDDHGGRRLACSREDGDGAERLVIISRDGGPALDSPAIVRLHDLRTLDGTVAALRWTARPMSFWHLIARAGGNADTGAVSVDDEFVQLAKAAAGLSDCRAARTVSLDHAETLLRGAHDRVKRAQQRCLDLAIAAGPDRCSFTFLAWRQLATARPSEEAGPDATCPCGRGRTREQVCTFDGLQADRRCLIDCDLCGPVGERSVSPPFRIRLRDGDGTSRGSAGQRTFEIELTARRDSDLAYAIGVAVERWGRRPTKLGPQTSGYLSAGASDDIALQVPSADLTGLAYVNVLAVGNGDLFSFRKLCEFK